MGVGSEGWRKVELCVLIRLPDTLRRTDSLEGRKAGKMCRKRSFSAFLPSKSALCQATGYAGNYEGRRMKRGFRAVPRAGFRWVKLGRGEIHALRRGSRAWRSAPLCQVSVRQRFFWRGALRGLSRNRGRGWNRLRGGSRPACQSRGAGRTGRRMAPHRRGESIREWPTTAVRWARRFDSPAPFGGLSLRAPASPASKTPPLPRRFSMSKGGSVSGGMAMIG